MKEPVQKTGYLTTLHVQITDQPVVETRDLNENVIVDLDANGRVVSMTIEHARAQSGNLDFSYELIAA